MQIISYDSPSELEALEDSWNRLAKKGHFFVPSFSELQNLAASGNKLRVLVAIDNSQIIAIACFMYLKSIKRFQIGSKRLFDLPIRALTLFGSCVLGDPDKIVIQEMFYAILREGGFDLITVGRIFTESQLYKAVTTLHGIVTWRGARREQLWWLVKLPSSFDEYILSLPETTRKHVVRDCRQFEREGPRLLIISRPEEVDLFLQDAEIISRRTYQWNLDYGIRNNESTRRHFIQLAKNGTLRCYLSYLHDKPCAFGWGEFAHQRFFFRQTGYDPAYRRLSPGTALIMSMIRDFIKNTDCKLFDFQWGGGDGYKSRLGTVGVACASVQMAQMYHPYALLIATLEQMLHMAKNSVAFIVEREPVKKRLRSRLRRHGIGTF